eukprot:g60965.t1
MRSALRPRRTRTSKNWRRASPPGSRMLCGFCMRGRATCHGSGCNRGCSLQQQPCVPLFLDALTLERQRTRLHLRLYRHRYAEQLLNWWRREDADWNVASCAIDARDDRTLEALAERHPQLKLGTKPYVYVRCVLECRGFALRGPCPGPQEGPGDYQISWQDLDDGRTRWFSQELAPWAASRLGWPTCVSDLIGFYLGPVSFGAGDKGI